MTPRLIAVLLAIGLLAPASAAAGTLLPPADETELAQTLAEAHTEQDVCYGWDVHINGIQSDLGSSLGPGVPLGTAVGRCQRRVSLEAHLTYACETCEGSDSADLAIESNLRDPPTVNDIEDLGYSASDLLGDKDDVTLIDMVGALPLLAAQRGNAPFIEYEAATSVPAQDGPTGTPGSDLLRDRWFALVLFGGLLLFGPAWFFYKRAQRTATNPDEE
ncbi:MAG TPA: hypothetical protein VES79_05580 [Solirubrobacteraceae bacterium]|nr:hypothetical protein [Solirubrobacteraceae bacterium]